MMRVDDDVNGCCALPYLFSNGGGGGVVVWFTVFIFGI